MPGASFQIVFKQDGQNRQAGSANAPQALGTPESAGTPSGLSTAPTTAPQAAPAFLDASGIIAAINELPQKLAAVLPTVNAAERPAPTNMPRSQIPMGEPAEQAPRTQPEQGTDRASNMAINAYRISQAAHEGGWTRVASAVGRATMVFEAMHGLVHRIAEMIAARRTVGGIHQAAQQVTRNAENPAPVAAQSAAGTTTSAPAGSSAQIAMGGIARQIHGVAAAPATGAGAGGLAAAALPIAAAAAVAVAAIITLKTAFDVLYASAMKLDRMFEQLSDQLGQFSPQLAFARGQAQFDLTMQQFRKANQLGPGLAEFTKQQTELIVRVDRIQTQFQRVASQFFNPMLTALNKIAGLVDPVLTKVESMDSGTLAKLVAVEIALAFNPVISFFSGGLLDAHLVLIAERAKLIHELMKKHDDPKVADIDKALNQFLHPEWPQVPNAPRVRDVRR